MIKIIKGERWQIMKKRVELLAPAGNKEAFMGAINAGADAIYLGGSKFGARAYAENFSEQEIIECIHTAHLFHVKVYLTINTLFKNEEVDELYQYLLPFYINGLDAVIIQDMGVLTYIKNNFPELEIHISTQASITSKYGSKLCKELGADRKSVV